MHRCFASVCIQGLFTVLFVLNTNTLKSQTVDRIFISASFDNAPMNEFLELLRKDYHLNVFYKDTWIQPYSITRNFKETPLIQALNLVFYEHDLTFRIMRGNLLFIFPRAADQRLESLKDGQVLVVGDPMNTGRYRTAEVSGRVLSGKDSQPLTGAVVYCPGFSKGTTTDMEGKFSLVLPTGDHNLQISFMGFQVSHVSIRLIEDGSLDFELFEESHAISEITITGQATDIPRSQTGLIRMSAKEIRQLPSLMGEVDILKGLSLLAGVQTVGELSSGYNVRGGNTDQNLLLVSGSPVFNSSHLFGFLSLINPDLVSDIRLYKGGIPPRFGERTASVMEIDLKEGNPDVIRVSGGLGLINSRLSVDGPLFRNKKLTLAAGGRSSHINWILRQIPDLELSRSKTSFYDFSGKMAYKLNPRNKATMTAYISKDEFSTSSTTVSEYGNFLGSFGLVSGFGENLSGNLLLSFSRYDFRLSDYAMGSNQEAYFLKNSIDYLSCNYQFNYLPHPLHKLEAGLKAIGYLINPGKVTPMEETSLIKLKTMGIEKGIEWAGYFSDEMMISAAFSLNFGIRFSQFGNYGSPVVYVYEEGKPRISANVTDSLLFKRNEVIRSYGGPEPRVSLNYDLSSSAVVKLNFQRTRQYVFQLSNNAVISPAETWKTSDYHLKPLISDQISIALEKNLPERGIDLTSEIYYKKLDNLVEYKNGAKLLMNEHIETSLIPSEGYSWGIELSAGKRQGRMTGYVSYVYSRVMKKTESRFSDENIGGGNYYPSQYDKPHDFSLTTTYNISRRWRISGNFVFISGRPVTLPELKYDYAGQQMVYYSDRNKYRMPPYHRADIALTFDENLRVRRMWKGSWTFSVYNLYGRHNPYSVYYRKSDPSIGQNYRTYSLYKLSVIGVPVPSITYNFRF